jgi:hypothetical protein
MAIFGDIERFAVEYALDDDHGGVWLFGKICFWVRGRQVGDYPLGASLRDALVAIEHLLRDRGQRENPRLFHLPARQVAEQLDEVLYRGESTAYDAIALDEIWGSRFRWSPTR